MLTFSFPVTVYIEDTDALGVVYYANYLKFAERARSEWFASLGVSHKKLIENYQTQVVVADVTIKYHKSAVLEDRLEVTVSLISLLSVSMVLEQFITRGQDRLATLTVRLGFVDTKGKKKYSKGFYKHP